MTHVNHLRTMTLAAALAGAAGLNAAPASAGGLSAPVAERPVAAPAPAPVRTDGAWTGGYVGGDLSYGHAEAGLPSGDGILYGVRAGYDYDFGKFVLGGGIDYDKSNIDLSGGAGKLDEVARLKVRAGADLGQTLVYATAGGARAAVKSGGVTLRGNGYFGGIGAERRLRDNLTVGGEILLHRFDSFAGSGSDLRAATVGVNVAFRF